MPNQLSKTTAEMKTGWEPTTLPGLHGYELTTFYQPAEGPDEYLKDHRSSFCVFPTTSDGRIAIVVVQIGGFGAAVPIVNELASVAREAFGKNGEGPAALVDINKKLAGIVGLRSFVCVVVAVLDPQKHQVTITNAGHFAPLRRRGNGTVDMPGDDAAGFPLGVVDETTYESVPVDLSPGEILVFFSGDVVETANAAGEYFTLNRLKSLLSQELWTPKEFEDRIVNSVRDFYGREAANFEILLVTLGRSV